MLRLDNLIAKGHGFFAITGNLAEFSTIDTSDMKLFPTVLSIDWFSSLYLLEMVVMIMVTHLCDEATPRVSC